MPTCIIVYLANTVDLTDIGTILCISRSATTVTEALPQKVPACSQNLVSVFPVRLPGFVEKSHSVNLQFLSSNQTFCKYFSVHSIDNFYTLAVRFWTLCFTSCSCMLLCSMKLYSVVSFCGILCGTIANKPFVHVNQFHSKTTYTACLIQSDKIPIACLRLQRWQQWLCAIASVHTPTVCFPPPSRRTC